jgi:hypothetical protein
MKSIVATKEFQKKKVEKKGISNHGCIKGIKGFRTNTNLNDYWKGTKIWIICM